MLPWFLRSALDSAPPLPLSFLPRLTSSLSHCLSTSLDFILGSLFFSALLSCSFYVSNSILLSPYVFLFSSLFLYLVISLPLPFICPYRSVLPATAITRLSPSPRRLSPSLLWFHYRVSDSANRHCLLPHDRFRGVSCFSKISKVSMKSDRWSQDTCKLLTFQI